jgi:polysaccharide pyruvyl transferase CsaB
MTKRPRLLISGAYGYGNIGDEAILRGMLLALREAIPDADFVVLSGNPALTRIQHGVQAVHRVLSLPSVRQMVAFGLSRIGRAQTRELIRQMRQADVFIVGGGGLLYDRVNTAKAIWLEKFYLFGWPISQWATEIGLARALGKPAVLYGVGIGPVTTRLGRLLLGRIARQVTLISVRDQASRAILLRYRVPVDRIHVTADPAILISPVSSEEASGILSQAGVASDKYPCIGLALRSWYPYVMSDKAAATERQAKWERNMAEAVDKLVESLDAELVFVPMQDYAEPFDDAACADRVIARMKHRERARSLPRGLDPMAVMGALGAMDLVVAMRLHALILAAAMSTPVVGIIYDPKIRAFLESIGQPDAGLEMDELSPEALVDVVCSVWARQEAIRAQIATSVEHLRTQARLNATLVADFLALRGD